MRFATLALGPGSRSARARALAALARDTRIFVSRPSARSARRAGTQGPRARCVPSPACGGGLGRGHAIGFERAWPLPPPPPQTGGGGARGGGPGLLRNPTESSATVLPPPPG